MSKNTISKKIKSCFLITLSFLLLIPAGINAQVTVTAGGGAAAVIAGLGGPGLTITNVTINCDALSYGQFSNGASSGLGVNAGLFISTGSVAMLTGSNLEDDFSYCVGTTFSDPQLTAISSAATNDVCIIEFDVVPQCTNMSITFVFGSDEYMNWVNQSFNDAFGFFVSGPNPSGGNYTNMNIATLPNGTPVSIDNVNSGSNPAYYVSNIPATYSNSFDGFTTVLSPTINVTPCATYHFKLAIADATDCVVDSGVLIDIIQCTSPWTVVTSSTPASCSGNDGTATATVSGGIGPFTYSWSPSGGTGSTATGLAAGTYTVTINDGLSCTPPQTYTVTVGSTGTPPTVTVSPASATICNGGSVVLTASGANTYSWSPATGLSATTGATVTASPTTTTTYTVTGTGACGTAIATTTITVTPLTTPTFTQVAAICSGGSFTLPATSNNGIAGSWSPAINNTATTTYTFTPNAGQCATTTTMTVTVNPQTTPTFTQVAAICSGGSFTLPATSNNGITGTWTPAINNTSTTTYTFTPSAGQCATTTTMTVTVNPLPVANAGSDISICNGQSATINASGSGTVSWSPSTGLSNTSSLTPTANPTVTTTYTLTLTSGSCVDTDDVTVFVTTPTPLTLNNDTSLCPGDCFTFTVSGADYYEWSPSTGLTNTTDATQTVCPTSSITYDVTGYTVGSNSVTNGDFSGGNTGFTSDYTFTPPPNSGAGQYFVGTSTQLGSWNGGMFSNGDHTTGTGNMLMVNGAGTPGANVWCQTITVLPNTDYIFSTWVSSFNTGSLAILQFSINGVPLSAPFTAPSSINTWSEYYATWNSGANTTATICILNQNTTLGGNDFGIDDIYFANVCTTTEQINITINNSADATITPVGPFCESSAAVNLTAVSPGGAWSGTGITNASAGTFNPSVSGAGTFTIQYLIPGSCGDTATTSIVVNPDLNATITPAGPFCPLDPAVNLSAVDPGGTWSGTGITDAVNGTFDPSVAGTGTYTITYAISGMCGDTQTTSITVNGQADATITPAGPFCESNTNVTLGAVDPGGTWSGPGIVNTVTGEFSPSTAGPGMHTITYSISGSCGDTQTITIQVLPDADATINPAGPFCITDAPFTMTAAQSGGVWGGTGITSTGLGTFDPSVAGAGTFNITYTISGACGDADNISVTVVDIISSTINAAGPFCADDAAVNLTAANPGGLWSGPGITNATNGTFDPSVAGSGTHTITYIIGGNCGSSSTIDITVNPLPVATFSADVTSGCVPLTVNFTDNTLPAAASSMWTISDGFSSIDNGGTVHIFNTPGTYSVTLQLTSADGCVGTTTITNMITVYANPVAEFSWSPINATILNPTINFVNESSGASIYLWDFAGLGTSTQTNPSFTFPNDAPDTYHVCLSASTPGGCMDTVCHEITIFDEFIVYVPNAFTPDNDGVNDEFYTVINGYDPDSYELLIFDRWGELIFSSDSPAATWDGTYRSIECKEDVYVWKLKVKPLFNGEQRQFVGHVTLLR